MNKEQKNNKKGVIALLLILFLLILLFFLFRGIKNSRDSVANVIDNSSSSDTIFITKIDTLEKTVIQKETILNNRVDTVYKTIRTKTPRPSEPQRQKKPEPIASSQTTSSQQTTKGASETSKPKSPFFADGDGDGKGDPNDRIMASSKPSGFVSNSSDDCPRRKANASNNGCPNISLNPETAKVYWNTPGEIGLEYPSKPGDKFEWTCADASLKNEGTKKPEFTFSKVGKTSVTINVSNKNDKYEDTQTKEIFVELSKESLTEIILNILNLGTYGNLQIPSHVKDKSNENEKLLNSFTSSKCVVLGSNSRVAIIGDGLIKDFIMLIKQPNMPLSVEELNPNNFSISKIEYDQSTGKINRIEIKD